MIVKIASWVLPDDGVLGGSTDDQLLDGVFFDVFVDALSDVGTL